VRTAEVNVDLQELCSQVIRRLCAQRGWSLITAEDKQFLKVVMTDVRDRIATSQGSSALEKIVERAAVHQYCKELYEACKANGTQRQHQAFEELWRYLYGIAVYRLRDEDWAQECAQQAIVKAWEKIDQCRDSGCFLKWAAMIVLNVIRGKLRGGKRKLVSFHESGQIDHERWERVEWSESDLMPDDDHAQGLLEGYATPVPSLETVVEEEDMRERLTELVRRSLRSKQQGTVIIELLINDRGVKEVAELLETTPSNVHTLKSRALANLRQNIDFLQTLEALLGGEIQKAKGE